MNHLRALVLVALASLLFACNHCPMHNQCTRHMPAPAAQQSHDAGVASVGTGTTTAMVHDPAHPPIDCPLRRAGIDPNHLQPFEDTERYIAFLERADRAAWQRPDAVVAALHLTGSETVADLGAGSGYFTFRIARALPQGQVIALDVSPEMVRHVFHRAMSEGVRNVRADMAATDDPHVPASADLVFVCDVLHHVSDRPAWLSRLFSEMRSGSRLVLIEFKEGPLPEGPPESVKIPVAQMMTLTSHAGFTLDSSQPDLLPYQTFLVFRRP